MGLIILCCAVFAVCVAIIILCEKIWALDTLEHIASAIAGVSLCFALVLGLLSLGFRMTANIYYEKKLTEYTILQEMVDTNTANTLVIMSDDIIEYNQGVKLAQRYHDNFWIGWLFSPRGHELPLIEISE